MSGLSRGYDSTESSGNLTIFPLSTREEVLESDGTLKRLIEGLFSYERECQRQKKKLIDHLFLKVATLSGELKAARNGEQKTIIYDNLSINTISEEVMDSQRSGGGHGYSLKLTEQLLTLRDHLQEAQYKETILLKQLKSVELKNRALEERMKRYEDNHHSLLLASEERKTAPKHDSEIEPSLNLDLGFHTGGS